MVNHISRQSFFFQDYLKEVHEQYKYHLKFAAKGYWTYDFALPMLVLHTLYHHSSERLRHWLQICPRQQLTTLDTHDGIGVIDVEDLLSPGEIERTLIGLDEKGSNTRRLLDMTNQNFLTNGKRVG